MIVQPNIDRLIGSAVFKNQTTTFESTLVIEYTSAKAIIKFTSKIVKFPLPPGLIFNGHTNKGIPISGEVDSYNNNITDKTVIADLSYLHIGNDDILQDLQEIKTKLLGVYYPFDIMFQHENYNIEFRKSEWTIDDAKRTKESTGAILDGNEIAIKRDKLITQI